MAFKLGTTLDEVGVAECLRAIAVQNTEQFDGLGHWKLQHFHPPLNFGIFHGCQKLILVKAVASICVRNQENFLDAVQLSTLRLLLTHPQPLLVLKGGCECLLDDDTHQDIHDAKGSDEKKNTEERNHVPLVHCHMAHHLAEPTVQSHHLHQGEHASPHCPEQFLVIPSTTKFAIVAVHLYVVTDLLGEDYCCDVEHNHEENNCPKERLHGIFQTL
mmetsp:Transcript_23329/g.43879  ORF Transcript_23329/g.43879 Transcript_23329/m.43879 type:complete len:216 (+) Transcript_23329:458-1105(+)